MQEKLNHLRKTDKNRDLHTSINSWDKKPGDQESAWELRSETERGETTILFSLPSAHELWKQVPILESDALSEGDIGPEHPSDLCAIPNENQSGHLKGNNGSLGPPAERWQTDQISKDGEEMEIPSSGEYRITRECTRMTNPSLDDEEGYTRKLDGFHLAMFLEMKIASPRGYAVSWKLKTKSNPLKASSMDLTLSGPCFDADFLVADSKYMKVAVGVRFQDLQVQSSSAFNERSI
ncbi:hypothetical protein Tco_0164044 [Tanacetum coccineum]